MATRSTKLGAGILVFPPNTATIYTCPTGFETIVKSLYAVTNAPDATVQLYIYQPSGVNILVHTDSFAAGAQSHDWNCWLVLAPGDQVVLYHTAGQLHYWLSGAQLPS